VWCIKSELFISDICIKKADFQRINFKNQPL
jgi:hypothetical protein